MALTLAQFQSKWVGKQCLSTCTGNTRGQCTDLVHEWSRNLGKGCLPRTHAKYMFDKADPNKWTKVRNTPSGKPPAGAVIVWARGTYGHVAIARSGCTTSTIYSLDQNWSVRYRVNVERHGYTSENIIGWLIPR